MKTTDAKVALENGLRLMRQDLSDTNALINAVEVKAKEDVEEIEAMAKEKNVCVSVDVKYTTGSRLKDVLGVFLSPSYNYDLKKYTAQVSQKHLLWYAVRDSIYDFYSLKNATVKKNTIKANKLRIDDLEIEKSYQNGNVGYRKTKELLDLVKLAKELNEVANGKSA